MLSPPLPFYLTSLGIALFERRSLQGEWYTNESSLQYREWNYVWNRYILWFSAESYEHHKTRTFCMVFENKVGCILKSIWRFCQNIVIQLEQAIMMLQLSRRKWFVKNWNSINSSRFSRSLILRKSRNFMFEEPFGGLITVGSDWHRWKVRYRLFNSIYACTDRRTRLKLC